MRLKAGESKTVTIPFDEYTFRYFNVLTNRWEVEGGEYEIRIGASCEDVRLTGTLRQAGTEAPDPYAASNPAKANLLDCYRACELADVPDAAFAAPTCGTAAPRWRSTTPFARWSTRKTPSAAWWRRCSGGW